MTMEEGGKTQPMLFERDSSYVSYRAAGNQRFGPYQLDELIVYYRCPGCKKEMRPSFARFCMGFASLDEFRRAAVNLFERASRRSGCEHCGQEAKEQLLKRRSYFFHFSYFKKKDFIIEVRRTSGRIFCRYALMDDQGVIEHLTREQIAGADVYFDPGMAEFRQGYAELTFHSRLEDARVHLSRALYLHPVFPEAELELARLSLACGKPGEADEHLEQAERMGTSDLLSRLLRAEIFIAEGAFVKAQSICRDILIKYPEEADGFYLRGMAYLNEGKKNLAARDFKQAISLDSAHARSIKALHELGIELPEESVLHRLKKPHPIDDA